MTVTTSPFEVDANSQYDRDSAPNQPYNCGPASVTNVLKFHRDLDFPINDTRRLATASNGRGTTSAERKVMMDRRGCPSEVIRLSPDQVRSSLNGLRTMEMALRMDLIPLSIRKRPFPGNHSVCVLAVGSAICPVHNKREPGIYVDNPDFHRDRNEESRYFYPDHAWVDAYLALGGWCVRPVADKVIPTRVVFRHSCALKEDRYARSGPGMNFTTVKRLDKGFRFSSLRLEKEGGKYIADGALRRDWVSFNLNGRLVWIKRAYVRVID
jgi:hypothetical protein